MFCNTSHQPSLALFLKTAKHVLGTGFKIILSLSPDDPKQTQHRIQLIITFILLFNVLNVFTIVTFLNVKT